MTGGDVGKESHHKHNRLGEHAHNFHDWDDGRAFEPYRHTVGPEDVLPIFLVAGECRYYKGEQRQYARNGDVAGEVGTARKYRHKTEKVVDENEEKHCHQERHELVAVFLAERCVGNVVAHKEHQHLHSVIEAVGSLADVALVIFSHTDEDEANQAHTEQHRKHIFGNRKVPRTLARSDLHDFALGGFGVAYLESLILCVSVMEVGRHKDMESALLTI